MGFSLSGSRALGCLRVSWAFLKGFRVKEFRVQGCSGAHLKPPKKTQPGETTPSPPNPEPPRMPIQRNVGFVAEGLVLSVQDVILNPQKHTSLIIRCSGLKLPPHPHF